MKSILFVIVFLCTGLLSAQKKSDSTVFARIEGNKFVIVGDTSKLKTAVTDLIFTDYGKKPNLNVKVSKGQTIGEKAEDYYFMHLQNKSENINVAKWLEKIGNELLLIEDFHEEKYWQILTTACIGKDDCSPQVAIIDGVKSWTCGSKLECTIEATGCKKISGIQTD